MKHSALHSLALGMARLALLHPLWGAIDLRSARSFSATPGLSSSLFAVVVLRLAEPQRDTEFSLNAHRAGSTEHRKAHDR